MREQGAQIDRAAALFQETGKRARLRIVWEQGSEFVAVMEEQLEADLRIGGIALGPAGFKGLAVASGGGRVDRVEHEEGISHKSAEEGAFGLLQAEGNFPIGETLFQRTGPLRDRFWSVLQGGGFTLARCAIVETQSVLCAAPIQPKESSKVAVLRFSSLTHVVFVG